MITHRPASTNDDLAAAGTLMSRAWRSAPTAAVGTPAGIEWWHATTYPDSLADHLRLWTEGGELVAWTWHDTGEVEWQAWTGQPARDVAVLEAILEDAIATTPGTIGIFSAEDDAATLAVLDHHGFAASGRRLSQWQRRTVEGALPEAPVPPGYRIRSLAGPAEVPARVEVHRAAFAPSRLSVEKYERLLTLPHYRYEDDLVVEAPDGSIAAFALAWWDPDGRVGEFEPVGTHPNHRRRGLARSLLHHGLHRFADLGAVVVQVYSDASDPGPEALYERAGFRRRAFHQRYERAAAVAASATAGDTADLQSTP